MRRLGNPRPRREDNIKMDYRDGGWETLTGSIWFRIGTGSSECGSEYWGSIKCGKFLE
jgi:hypothetical protein